MFGTIYSPNYPQLYPSNLNCSYVIQVVDPDAGISDNYLNELNIRVQHVVHVWIKDLEIEAPSRIPGLIRECPYDYLEIIGARRVTQMLDASNTSQVIPRQGDFVQIPSPLTQYPLYRMINSHGKYCGQYNSPIDNTQSADPTIKANTHEDFILVNFISDGSISKKGFSMRFDVKGFFFAFK